MPKWIAEGHKRLATPLTAVSYAFIGLFAVLSGTFRRHGSFVRPLVAVAAMVALLALGLAMENLAARDNAMLPMIWLQAVAPGMICGWMLFGPQWLAVASPTCRGRPERMTPPITLSIYIARQFAGTVIGMLLALSGLVALFDFIELLRRSISQAGRDLHPGGRDRRAAPALYRDAGAAVRRTARRHAVLLAPHAFVGA